MIAVFGAEAGTAKSSGVYALASPRVTTGTAGGTQPPTGTHGNGCPSLSSKKRCMKKMSVKIGWVW
jgi:hypothetical protein